MTALKVPPPVPVHRPLCPHLARRRGPVVPSQWSARFVADLLAGSLVLSGCRFCRPGGKEQR